MTENIELSHPPEEERVKQFLSDNYLTFLAKNTNSRQSGITVNQDVQICIPRTEHTISLAKGYFDVEMEVNYSWDVANIAKADVANYYLGVLNSATIFEKTGLNNNGADMEPNEFAQPQSRLWQMFKSSDYLNAQPYSFINYEDVSMNKNFILQALNEGENGDDGHGHEDANVLARDQKATYRMKIPIPCLYPCFENINYFNTTLLNDDVTLSMTFSEASKYMVLVYAPNGVVQWVKPLDAANMAAVDAHAIQISTNEDDYKITKFRMVVPGHYPDDLEKSTQAQQLNSGFNNSFTFKDFNIIPRGANFANGTQHISFPTNCTNISALFMLATHENSYVVYDKPNIHNIECNLAELYYQCMGSMLKDSLYERGMQLFRNLTLAVGSDSFKNFKRFDYSILHDYLVGDTAIDEDNLWGSFVQVFKVAAGNQIGFSADSFANMINYHFVSNGDHAAFNVNYAQAHLYCCQLRERQLIYENGGIRIRDYYPEQKNPNSFLNDDLNSTEHGLAALAPALVSPVTSLVGGLYRGIRGIVERRRAGQNSLYAYQTLGKDGYEKHREIIENNYTMKPKKFYKFVNNLAAAEKEITSHGIFQKHGAENEEGAGSATVIDTGLPKSSLDDYAHERPVVDYNALNLTATYRPSQELQMALKPYKMRIIMDYKHGANKRKYILTAYGNESAYEYNYAHGFRDWIRRGWNRVREFFRRNGRQIGETLLANGIEFIKQYAADVINGKITIKDVPAKFRDRVLLLIKEGKLTGTDLDDKLSEVLNYANKIRSGTMDWSQVPAAIIDKVRAEIQNNTAQQDTAQGLFAKHGLIDYTKVKPTVDMHITKRRMQSIINKPASLRTPKDSRRLLMYSYFREHPMSEATHGKLYSNMSLFYNRNRTPLRLMHPKPVAPKPILRNPLVNPVINKPKPKGPSFEEIADKYREKLRQLKSVANETEHGKAILVKIKSSNKYHGMSDKKKYKLLKYGIKML